MPSRPLARGMDATGNQCAEHAVAGTNVGNIVAAKRRGDGRLKRLHAGGIATNRHPSSILHGPHTSVLSAARFFLLRGSSVD
jgi:hypothetical protein